MVPSGVSWHCNHPLWNRGHCPSATGEQIPHLPPFSQFRATRCVFACFCCHNRIYLYLDCSLRSMMRRQQDRVCVQCAGRVVGAW